MARILLNGDWYYELSPSSLYEVEYERVVLSQAKWIFPEFFVIPFKPQIQSEIDLVKPDLAIIDKNYRLWWVVEIELATHSLLDHIIPQLQKLKLGHYSDSLSTDFCRESPLLDKARIISMLKGKSPGVLLVLNKPMDNWKFELLRLNVTTMVIEVFRSSMNGLLLRINGEYPKIETQSISTCYLDPVLPNLLVLESPGGVDFLPGEEIRISYENYLTYWNRIDIQNKVFLSPKTMNPLEKSKRYELFKKNDNSYLLLKKNR